MQAVRVHTGIFFPQYRRDTRVPFQWYYTRINILPSTRDAKADNYHVMRTWYVCMCVPSFSVQQAN